MRDLHVLQMYHGRMDGWREMVYFKEHEAPIVGEAIGSEGAGRDGGATEGFNWVGVKLFMYLSVHEGESWKVGVGRVTYLSDFHSGV